MIVQSKFGIVGKVAVRYFGMRFGIAQLRSTDDKKYNFETIQTLCEEAKMNKVNFLCFPENFAFMGSQKNKAVDNSETLDGELFGKYKSLAVKNDIWISFGGFPEKINDKKIYNTHVIVDNKGEIRKIYRKIHLFDVDIPNGPKLTESAFVAPGKEIETCKYKDVTIGMSICYDLRFPELYMLLREMGSHVVLIPAAFTEHTGKAHWKILCQSRAIETQCYVIAAAQTGQHNETRSSFGHSLIIDPWGKILCELEGENILGYVDLDLADVEKVRMNLPVFEHRKYAPYQIIQKK